MQLNQSLDKKLEAKNKSLSEMQRVKLQALAQRITTSEMELDYYAQKVNAQPTWDSPFV